MDREPLGRRRGRGAPVLDDWRARRIHHLLGFRARVHAARVFRHGHRLSSCHARRVLLCRLGRAADRDRVVHPRMTDPARRRWWFAAERGTFIDYCLIAWPLALVPSIILAALAYAVLSGAGADMAAVQRPMRDIAQRQLWIALLAAPLVETLLLALGVTLIGLVTKH